MIDVTHLGPDGLLLGVVYAEGVDANAPVPALETHLATLLARRVAPITAEEDDRRTRVRDVFRNGRYKPTGRAKPASEYLIRAAQEGSFPRINTLVDACNAASLSWLFPISILDPDRAGTDRFTVRLGRPDESYVFNTAGQSIDLEDLIVGCADDRPIVNAVKDSMATKTTPDTHRVVALVYGVNAQDQETPLEACCAAFAGWLEAAGAGARATFGIARPGGTVSLGEAYGAPTS